MRRVLIAVFILFACATVGQAAASNLYVLEGSLVQSTDYTYRITLQPDGSRLDCNVSLLDSVNQPWYRVSILDQAIHASTMWSDRYDSENRYGYRSARLNWYSAPAEVIVEREVRTRSEAIYGPITLSDTFPVSRDALPWSIRSSALAATDQSQSDDAAIISTADAVTAESVSQLDAVVRILSWIRRTVVYACSAELCDPVYRTDALFTLEKKKGNCVSYAHLAVALLRAVGIPAVEAEGFVADRAESSASHAWIAVYFPSYEGWIEFESADWMPAYREAPVTFLMPQHLSIRIGEATDGISRARFSERHEASFTITQRPEAKTEVRGAVAAGQPIAWVMTVERPSWETAQLHLSVLDAPAGWTVSLSERDLVIDENDVSPTIDVLVTIIPPAQASRGTIGVITVGCSQQGTSVGNVRFEVEVSS